MADDAEKIFQDVLDVTTPLVHAGDVAGYCRHVVLPFVFRTAAGETVIETEEDLAADIAKITDWLTGQGVTDYFRLARNARFLTEDRIEGFYVTYALRRTVMVIEPYTNRMIIERGGDGAWRCVFAEHELAGPLYPAHPARAARGIFAEAWEGRIGSTDYAEAKAGPIYQAFLDTGSRHVMARDFDAWIADFSLPLAVHYDTTDHTVTVPGQKRPFFDALCRTMQDTGADSFLRKARHAVFLSPDRIFGYHEVAMLRAGEVCFGPIRSRMILTREGGRWLCCSVTNSLSNTGFLGGALQPSEDLPTLREIEKRMNT